MTESARVRLGSFNLLSGRSLADGRVDTGGLISAIRTLDVDLLAVQEVDRFQPRSGGTDQTALIAATLGATASRFVATVDGTPGEPGWTPSLIEALPGPGSDTAIEPKAEPGPVAALGPECAIAPEDAPGPEGAIGPAGGGSRLDVPQFGVALISRLPVAQWHVLRLEPARGRFPIPIPSRPPRLLWLNDEPRVVIAAVLERPRITVACTHLSFVPTTTVRQLRAVRDWLERLPGPRFLLGDLNLPPGPVHRITRWTPLVAAPTFPSPAPRLQLDHVLASELPAGSRAAGRVLRMPISDHRAVVVDLDLPLGTGSAG